MGRGKGVARSQIAEHKMHTQRFDDQALQILLKEYDTLRDLFSQAETSAQNIFNFYLTGFCHWRSGGCDFTAHIRAGQRPI